VVVVNYIGDVVKQLMATAADQQGGAPGGPVVPHQPAALPAPPPPDRGHVLHVAPGGAAQPSDADTAEGSAAGGAEVDSDSAGADGEADGAASSDGPACTECSALRTGSITAVGPAKTQPRRHGDPTRGGEQLSADTNLLFEQFFGPRRVDEESGLTAQVRLRTMHNHCSLKSQMTSTFEI
jgi:hypothetical protein